jgi:hypothetical protein
MTRPSRQRRLFRGQRRPSTGDLPCFLGLYGRLERACFAVDPRTERFYFGPAAEVS